METLLIYFLKMIVFSSLMFGYYFVFLKDKTFHHYNRFYLLSIVVVSIFLPLIKVEYFTIEVNPDIYLLLNQFQTIQPQNSTSNDFTFSTLALATFGLVSLFFIIKFLTGLLKIQQLKKQYPKTEFEGINFYETPLEDAPFSFFRNLFWKNSIPLQSDLGRQILKHEMVHIEQKHTWDKLLISTVQSLFWFNPVFYFLKKEIALIHEYLADKKTIQQSDTKAFAEMLLGSHFTETTLPATSPFLSSNLKKRLIMLKKSHTKYSYARKILALPLVFAIGFAFLVNAKNREISATNVEIAEAVSQIKKDTIREETYNGKRYKLETTSFKADGNFDELILNAPENSNFTIGNKKVSKSEYVKLYKKNKNDQFLKFTVSEGFGKNAGKSFGTLNLKDEKNVVNGRVYDKKIDGEINPNSIKSLVAASYAPKGLNVSYSQNLNKSSEKDQFYFNYKKISRNDFLKLINSGAGKSDYYFGYIESVDNNKIFSAIDDINLQLPDEFFNALNKKNSEKTVFKSGNYSGTAVYVEDSKNKKNNNKYTATAIYNENFSTNPFFDIVDQAKETASFFINKKRVDKDAYIKFVRENKENKRLQFSYFTPSEAGKYQAFYASIEGNDLIKKELIKAEQDKNATKKNNPWIIGVGAHSTSNLIDPNIKYYVDGKSTDSSVLNSLKPNQIKSVNVVKGKDTVESGSVFISTKSASEIEATSEYNKIYINGKLSTQADLNKIDKNKITSQKIKKNNDNGKVYNEIKLRTKN